VAVVFRASVDTGVRKLHIFDAKIENSGRGISTRHLKSARVYGENTVQVKYAASVAVVFTIAPEDTVVKNGPAS